MYKVTWSKRYRAFTINEWPYKDNTPQTHTKEYPTLNAIYGDVEVAWSKNYVPRVIEHDGLAIETHISNSPVHFATVYKNLKEKFDIIKKYGGFKGYVTAMQKMVEYDDDEILF